jgi:4-amino-4-deoxy-L-arabinose transferase-like glycosyltransferase
MSETKRHWEQAPPLEPPEPLGPPDPLEPLDSAQLPQLPQLALLPVLAIAVAITALLDIHADGFGYYRDELYFLSAGRHLAWGYPDQPPFVPLIARLMSDVAPGSLAVLQLPNALAGGALILLTALLAREFRGGKAAQLLACAMTAVAPFISIMHGLSTEGFDLLATVLLCWLFTLILRTGLQQLWLVAGLAAGIGLLASDLVGFLVLTVVAGVVIAGPRRPLRSGWFYAGGVIALALWSPYLAWQASHGWPQLAVAHSIATGGSGSPSEWWNVVPGQLEQVPIWFAPVWITGLLRLLRNGSLRRYRAIGIAFLLLAVVFTAASGRPYYLAVVLPVLLAAGAQPTVEWLARGRRNLRRGTVAVGLVLSAALLAISLPIVPARSLQDMALAPGAAALETVGWPAFVREIAHVYNSLPPAERLSTVVVTSNYGEAGAVDRYGHAYGLPTAYSPQTGYWYWGPPPAEKTVAVIVGADAAHVRMCGSARVAATLNDDVGIDNVEQGKLVWICTQLRRSWPALWPQLRYLG